MDGGAWWAAVHGVARSRTRLSDFTFTFHFHALEEEMASHSSVPAWRIPVTGEPGGLPSVGSRRVGHGWSDFAAAAAAGAVNDEMSGRRTQRESLKLRVPTSEMEWTTSPLTMTKLLRKRYQLHEWMRFV